MPRSGLDTARVVEEAARIADAEGLAEVTLARVAESLGVRAPSLYNHVEGLPGMLRLLTILSLEELTDAIRNAGVVPRFGLFGVTHQKADCAAVKGRCRLAIDGFGDHETAAIVRVSQPASGVFGTWLSAHCGKEGI